MRCDLHPDKHAKRRCDHCGARMCKACRNYDRGRLLCPVCAQAVARGFSTEPFAAGHGLPAPFDRAASALAEIPRALDEALPPWTGSSHEPSPLLAAVLSAIVPGLGQVYNGRFLKGVLVFCTAFLFVPWVFGIVDAAVEASRRARRYRAARYALGGAMAPKLPAWRETAPAAAPTRAATGARRPTGDELKQELLRAAVRHGGELSVTDGVLETGATFDEVQKALDGLLYKGVVDVDNRPGSGVVVYRFHELAGRPAAQ